MKSYCTYFQNDPVKPIKYGELELINPPRQRLRGEPLREGVLCEPVLIGFCGTDYELMKMGAAGKLSSKFPAGQNRLINGHEGIVWVPSEKRFAIVLIRGGDSYDPTRFTEDETYFEYGCDNADGLFSDRQYFNPDMLLRIPDGYVKGDRVDLEFAKKMVFPDPYACMVFQLERMEDIGVAQGFRVEMAHYKCSRQEAEEIARKKLFERTVIFGLGTTGMFIADLIRQNYPDANIVFIARSAPDSPKVKFAQEIAGGTYVQSNYATEAELAAAIEKALGGKAKMFIGTSGANLEHRIAFEQGVLGCNGVYNSFSLGPKVEYDTMPFGFRNHVIMSSINFRQDHMEKAIGLLAKSRYNEIVALIDRDEFTRDPLAAYEDRIYSKAAPMKTAVIWNPAHIL